MESWEAAWPWHSDQQRRRKKIGGMAGGQKNSLD